MRLAYLFCGLLAVHYCVSATVDLSFRLDIVEMLLHRVIKNDIAMMKEKLTNIQAENTTSHIDCCDKKDQAEMDQKREEIKMLFNESTERTQAVIKAFSREKQALRIQTNEVSEALSTFRYTVDDLANRVINLSNQTDAQQEIFGQFMKKTNHDLKEHQQNAELTRSSLQNLLTDYKADKRNFDQFIKATNQDLTDKQQNIELIMSSLQKLLADYEADKKHFQDDRSKIFDELRKERNDVDSLKPNGEIKGQFETKEKEISCKDGWELQLNTCILYVINNTFTWSGAQNNCRYLGGYLVEPSSSAAMELLIQNLPAKGQYQRWWIGATDRSEEGVWRWESTQTEIGIVLWNENEPNNVGGSENCMELILDSVLNDDSCEEYEYRKNYICEIRH